MILYKHYGIFHVLLYSWSQIVGILISILQFTIYVTIGKPLNLFILSYLISNMQIKIASISEVVMSIILVDKW